jgi:hypothetical protein
LDAVLPFIYQLAARLEMKDGGGNGHFWLVQKQKRAGLNHPKRGLNIL